MTSLELNLLLTLSLGRFHYTWPSTCTHKTSESINGCGKTRVFVVLIESQALIPLFKQHKQFFLTYGYIFSIQTHMRCEKPNAINHPIHQLFGDHVTLTLTLHIPKIVKNTKNMGWNTISMATNGGSRYILNSSSLNILVFPKSWGYRDTPLAGWFRMEKSYKKWRKPWATASLEALSPRRWCGEWPGRRNMVWSWGVHSDFIGIS